MTTFDITGGNLSVAGAVAAPILTAVAVSNVSSLSGLGTYDGVTLAAGNVILLTAQTTASQNGPWTAASGLWTRPSWYASGSSVSPLIVVIAFGTSYARTIWMLAAAVATVDTSISTWVNNTQQLNPAGWLTVNDIVK